MTGDFKISGNENPLSGLMLKEHKNSRERGIQAEESGFLSILRESVDASGQAGLLRDESAEFKAAEDRASTINSADYSGNSHRSEHDSKAPESGSSINETSSRQADNEKRAENGASEKADVKSQARKKSDETGEALKEKNTGNESLQTLQGGALAAKIADAMNSLHGNKAAEAGRIPGAILINPHERRSLMKGLESAELKQKARPEKTVIENSFMKFPGKAGDLFEAAARVQERKAGTVKRGSEHKALRDNENSETAPSVLAAIKRGRARDGHAEVRAGGQSQEAVNEKKTSALPEQVLLKQKENASEGFSDRGSGSGRQQRDGDLQGQARLDLQTRVSSEKGGQLKNLPEFRQSLQEIMDKAKVTVKDSSNGSFTVKLFPKDLGNVNVNLVLENGIVHGKFLVDNNDVRNALLASLDSLREQLEQSGVSVGEFSVNVKDGGERSFYNNDDRPGFSTLPGSGNEVAAAAGIYDSTSYMNHNGSINMII